MQKLGITHILNASKGEKFSQINTNQLYYDVVKIEFFGLNLMDLNTVKIYKHFDEIADYINEVLGKKKGIDLLF